MTSPAQQFQSAEEAAISRADQGISEHDMPGGWRVLIARKGEKASTWYFHTNDDKRLAEALRKCAWRWLGDN